MDEEKTFENPKNEAAYQKSLDDIAKKGGLTVGDMCRYIFLCGMQRGGEFFKDELLRKLDEKAEGRELQNVAEESATE